MNRLVHAFQSRRRESRPQTVTLQSTTDSLSSSSDGSVPTPEDDPDASARSSSRFAKWLRSSSSSSKSSSSSSSTKQKPLHPTTVWSPPQDPILPSDSEDDDSDNYGDDATLTESLPPPPLLRPPPIPASSPIRPSSRSPGRSNRTLPDRSHQNLRDITLSAINQRPPCPPFLHAPSGLAFPRSSNPSLSLPVVQTTRIVHLKTNLVRRLEANSLTRTEHESITPFYSRSKHNHSVLNTRRRLDLEDVSDLKDTKRVQDFSHGLQRWINRPCFEERCVAWYWDSDGKEVVSRSIPGSGKAVALLEFSEGLEAMAGFGLFSTAGWQGEVSARLSSLTIPPVPRLDTQMTGSSNPSPGPDTPKNTSPSVHVRKALRFAPDYFTKDDEDNVPLGIHLSRREEQEREEKKKKTLAEEVVKARMRADAVRTGAADKERLHDSRRTYTRPIYDTHASSPSLQSVTGAVKRGPDVFDAAARKPFNVRSSTWNGDIPQQQFSSTYLSPPAISDSSEGTKGQRRSSMLIAAPRSDTGGHTTSSSRLRTTVVPPVIPLVPLPMQMQAHPAPVYPFQLQHMVPVAPSSFMQSRFMVPSSPIFDPLALPPPPPIRTGIPVSRSAERLIPSSSSAYSAGKSTKAARRTTVGSEELKQMAEQMKRSGFYPEQSGRLHGTTTSSPKRDGRGMHESRHLGGREERSEAHRKVGVDSRSQSGRMEEQKRLSRMPSALPLPPKQSTSRLIPR